MEDVPSKKNRNSPENLEDDTSQEILQEATVACDKVSHQERSEEASRKNREDPLRKIKEEGEVDSDNDFEVPSKKIGSTKDSDKARDEVNVVEDDKPVVQKILERGGDDWVIQEERECYPHEDDHGNDDFAGATEENVDIHEVVNEVLDNKLENFQAQIQKMFTMMQSSMKESNDGQDESVENKAAVDPTSLKSPQRGDAMKDESNLDLGNHQTREWKEFLGQVSSDLELPYTETRSLLDATVGSSGRVLDYLPVEGIVRNSWQKVEGRPLYEITGKLTKHMKGHYGWSLDDMESFGTLPKANEILVNYLNNCCEANPRGMSFGLPVKTKKFNQDIRSMEHLFRYLQRVVSYASYFTAVVSKNVANDTGKDKVKDTLKKLGECLIEISDMSVNGCVLTTKAIRRLYLDALNVQGNVANLLELPLAHELFPQSPLTRNLKYHGVNLFKPQSTQTASRGPVMGNSEPNRPSGRGMHFQKGQRGSFQQTHSRAGHSRGGSNRGRGFRGGQRGVHHPVRGSDSYRSGHHSSRGGLVYEQMESEFHQQETGKGDMHDPTGFEHQWSKSGDGPDQVRGGLRHRRGGGRPPRRGGQHQGRGKKQQFWSGKHNLKKGGYDNMKGGRGGKRPSTDTGPAFEKRQKMESTNTVQRLPESKPWAVGDYSPTKRADCNEKGGINYQSVPDNPSSYYRSPSELGVVSLDNSDISNEGWY